MTDLLQKFRAIIVLGAFGLTALGALLAYFLPHQWWLGQVLQKPAQELTLQQLLANGFGDNPFVKLSEFRCSENYVFVVRGPNGAGSPQEMRGSGNAWIPLHVNGKGSADEPESDTFRVLLKTQPTIGSGATFHALSRRRNMPGVVYPCSAFNFAGQARTKMRELHPQLDLSQCLIFEEVSEHDIRDAPSLATMNLIATIVSGVAGLSLLCLMFRYGLLHRRSPLEPALAESGIPENSP